MTISTRKILLAVLSGTMLTAAFPPGRLDWMAWFAVVPILISLENEPPSNAFKLGFIAGAVHFLTLIYWIVVAIGHYGDLNVFLSAATLLLLCLYLALYLGFFSIFSAYVEKSRFALLFTASFWVGLEYARAHLLTGFPWCLLGYTQFKNLHLIQIADLCGVYGLSFLIVIVNILIYHIFFRLHKRGLGLHKWEFLFTVLMAGLTLTYGHFRLTEEQTDKGPPLHVNSVTIQGNIDQSVKWAPAHQAKTMMTYQRLTRSAYGFKPGLIVWPETSLPFFFQDNKEYAPKVYSIARKSGAFIVFGSPAYKIVDGNPKYYNRAYLVTPNDQSPQYYDKVHLLPFGEYVPLKNLLFFVSRLVPAAGDFDAGGRIAPLRQGKLSMGILICYEAIFPELARAHALEGANILINITNDAWFGMTSAPYQHLHMAAFRTVENRIPMIRAANTGLSAFIGIHGNIIDQSDPFTNEVLKATLDISKSPFTFYTRFGDIFAFVAIVMSLIGIASCLFTRRKVKK
jgi:apolipoprotein N-acyltransferase